MNCETGCKLFGAYRVAISIKDSTVLIHSTVGCNWGTMLFHTPSQLTDIRQACTVIYEEDLVFGGEKILFKALNDALNLYQSRVTFLLTGCVPEIMNDDIEGVLEKSGNMKPVYYINAAGFKGDTTLGVTSAIDMLICNMTKKNVIESSVNIIGVFSDDFKVDADLDNIKTLICDVVKINAVVPYDFYENILNVPAAALNVVFEGFEAIGEKLQNRFGTPYIVVNYPYGVEGSRYFVDRIVSALQIRPKNHFASEKIALNQLKKVKGYVDRLRGMPVALIVDSVRIKGLKALLENELGMSVEVSIDTSKSQNNISYIEQVRQSNAILIIGSSFERNIAEKLSVPFMQFTYPVFDKVCISKNGYAGFEGLLCFVEDILNTIFEFDANFKVCHTDSHLNITEFPVKM